MLTIEEIKRTIEKIAPEYDLKRVTLFGSRANGNFREDSDVDLIVEFSTSAVSLLKLISLKHKLEDFWGLSVDIIHGPISSESIFVVEKGIDIYAA